MSPEHKRQDWQTSENASTHDAHPLSDANDAFVHITALLCVWAVAFSSATHFPFEERDVPSAQIRQDDVLTHDIHDEGHSPHVSPEAK